MKTISRYIMTLALLLTAVTGAWADSFSTEAYKADATLSAVSVTGNTTLTINKGVTVTVNNGLTINSGATLTVTGGGNLIVNGSTGANGADGRSEGEPGSTAISGSGQLAIANATITATGGAGGKGGFDEYSSEYGGDGAPAVSGVSISIQTGSLTAIGGAGGIGGTSTVYNQKYPDGYTANAFSSFPNISDATLSYSTDNVTYTEYESGNTALYRYMKVESLDEPAIEVTTNAASEQDLFTEAKFNMPAFDATAEYELVRDMSIQMTATMGDGTNGVRYRVKKAQQGQGYEPADLSMTQVLALVAVNDDIEHKDLTLNQDYFCRIYKLDEQTLQPEGDGVKLSDFDFAPGLYALKAFAKDDSDYAGETPLSNTFKLFQGYEVEVAAKEFITYYKDEALYVEDEAAELYTIQSVSGDQAVLSDKSDAMPSNTPMLVYNKSNETKVILLIPCAEPDMDITVAPEFQGTAVDKQMEGSSASVDYYILSHNAFVKVQSAGTIAANHCWLEISKDAAGARAINIVVGEATGVTEVKEVIEVKDDTFYDLNGSKLQGIPTKKGVYINNGRKVVIK